MDRKSAKAAAEKVANFPFFGSLTYHEIGWCNPGQSWIPNFTQYRGSSFNRKLLQFCQGAQRWLFWQYFELGVGIHSLRFLLPLSDSLKCRSSGSFKQWSKLGRPRDLDTWEMYPSTVNAYFNPPSNEVRYLFSTLTLTMDILNVCYSS